MKIGFIGLGNVGGKLAGSLLRNNFDLTVRDLDERLTNSKFLAGENYSIADIATWPWIARHQWHDIGLNNYKNLTRWYQEIANREAVIRGYDFMKKGEIIPQP